MTIQQQPTQPLVVVEKSKRRRAAGIIAASAMGLALVTGATIAAFQDTEWVKPGDGNGYTAARFNLQIAQGIDEYDLTTTSTNWQDTARVAGVPDGPHEEAAAVVAPLELGEADALVPDVFRNTTFYLLNDGTSNQSLTFKMVDAMSSPTTAQATLRDNLVFQVKVTKVQRSGDIVSGWDSGQTFPSNGTYSWSQAASGQQIVVTAEPKAVYKVEVLASITEAGAKATNVPGTTVDVLVSTVATPTA
ncbi:MAG: SipW-dependent-type signal peptide-containing protein [Bifidobacteriaceae bacterium]|jgi:predicted ribosomally synthesized peptide with SipW-like signal peptide|nr:SipW-dependent-type signal peptide-containing protein [Bifidobacteriaceae bacterium]